MTSLERSTTGISSFEFLVLKDLHKHLAQAFVKVFTDQV